MTDTALLVAKRLAESYNQKDWSAFANLLDRNAVFEGPNVEDGGVERFVGKDAILEFMKAWSKIIPDDKATFTSSQLVDDETVNCEVVWSGTRTGIQHVVRGITVPADGSSFVNRGSTTYKVQGGKITRITDRFDIGKYLSGFGLESH